MAVFGIVVGAAMIVFALTGLNTWAAFSEKGSLGTYVRVPDDEEPPR